MLQKLYKQRKKQSGFTIIEVMIVLAIAGLIMLIVFLAVPALERTSRNTQRKNDVSAIASAISNYEDNNGGDIPDTFAISGGTITLSCTGSVFTGDSCTTGTGNTETAKVGYYKSGAIANVVSEGTGLPTLTTDTITVDVGYTCNANETGVGPASARSVALLYEIEPTSSQCLEAS